MSVVGFIGLGVMGRPMALNIHKGGFTTRVFDVDPDAVAELAAAGAIAATTPAGCAAGADVVITMLPNGGIVEDVLFDDDGVMDGLQDDAVVVDMSTILPAQTDAIGARMADAGKRFVDAPVGRTSAQAVTGELLIMVGGAPEDLAAIRPVLETLGDSIVHCGPVGAGARMKIVNNFMSITLNATTTEALLLAEASGLDPELARQVMLSTTAGKGHMATTYPTKVLQGDVAPGFAIDLAHKDLMLAIEMGRLLGVSLATGNAALERYDAARNVGRGGDDWTAVYADGRRRQGWTDDPASR